MNFLFLQKHHRLVFYSAWLCLALLQAGTTELLADEAYYWVYSRFLSWGYFDHPPMVALLIKGGYSLFHNEYGVRLFCVFLNLGTLLIAESLSDKKNPLLFYSIALSLGVLQIAGFLAVPDTPLLFFTALFFYCYRLYIKNHDWRSAVWLGISVALLFYTKYHGLLLVFFTFLSNRKLLIRWQSWLAAAVGLLLFLPHLYWQWEHNWVSFRYHLFESNVNEYRLSFTINYFLGQLLLTGPFAGLILLPAVFLYKTKDETEKALKYTLVGLFLFFLASSFRGKVEINWTLPIIVPLIVLGYQFLSSHKSWQKGIRVITLISVLLVFAGRIYLVADLGPDNAVKTRFHFHKSWAKIIAEKTQNRPVVFFNSYQRASLFWFYSGKPSHSHNAYWDRRNNYNFWPTESGLLGQPVFLADIYQLSRFADSVKTPKGWVGLQIDSLYAALGGIQILPALSKIKVAGKSGVYSLQCKLKIPSGYSSFLDTHKKIDTELIAGIFRGKKLVSEIRTGISAQQLVETKSNLYIPLHFENLPAGKYILRLGIQSKNYPPTHNSEKVELEVK